MLKTLLTCLLGIAAHIAFAQPRIENWGKVPKEDLEMTVYLHDTSAAAVVLQDVGGVTLTYDGQKWVVNHNRSRRIKVLDVSAFDKGNLIIPYRGGKSEEKMLDLDVQVIFPDGKKEKVKSDNVFTEKINKHWSAKKVFIPNLQKGAIIEYRYLLRSNDYFTLYDWYFQEDIPVRWSELKVTVPEYFDYVYLMRSPRQFDVRETKVEPGVALDGSRYNTSITRLGLANMPAIKEEPYITTLDDYRAHIGFQLKSVQFPQQRLEPVLTSWAEVGKELESMSRFGEQYDRSGNFNRLWAAFSTRLPAEGKSDAIAEAALRFVSSNINWNGEYRFFPEKSLDDAFEKKTGNSADLNLALVALLKKAGVPAKPMLVSTRSNGEMYPQYPFVSQFNSVVAFVPQGESGLLLDATSPYHAVNEMRLEHYNGSGWVVDTKAPVWVDLRAPEGSVVWAGDVKLSEAGEMSGVFTMLTAGYIATNWRKELEETKAEEFLRKKFSGDYPDTQVDSVVFTDLETYSKPLKVKFNCRIPGTANAVNDFIYCKPVLDFFFNENPFKTPKRNFSVNFPCPLKAQYVLAMELPTGYGVEELPAPIRLALPNNGGKLSFSCDKMPDGKIQLVLKMSLAQLEFLPDEYDALRMFFDQVAEKTQLQLVLKKT